MKMESSMKDNGLLYLLTYKVWLQSLILKHAHEQKRIYTLQEVRTMVNYWLLTKVHEHIIVLPESPDYRCDLEKVLMPRFAHSLSMQETQERSLLGIYKCIQRRFPCIESFEHSRYSVACVSTGSYLLDMCITDEVFVTLMMQIDQSVLRTMKNVVEESDESCLTISQLLMGKSNYVQPGYNILDRMIVASEHSQHAIDIVHFLQNFIIFSPSIQVVCDQ